MKLTIWSLKSVAIEVWWLRRKAGIWLAQRVAICAAALMLGWAGAAVWEMIFLPVPVNGYPRELREHAPLKDCKKEIEKIQDQLKKDGGGRIQFSCRVDTGGQWLERWRASAEDSVSTRAEKYPSVSGFEWLDDMAWRASDPSPSWRGFAELMGWGELTEASRGWGEGARFDGVVGAALMAMKGWILVFFMVGGGILHVIGTIVLFICLAVAWLVSRQSWVSAKARWALALAVCVWLSSATAIFAAALMLDALREGISTRWTLSAPTARCEERFERVIAREPGGRWGCREEGGRMLLAGYAPEEWGAERLQAEADRLFGADVSWSAVEKAPVAFSWQAYKELSGWEPATIASRSKMSQAPKIWESGWSWRRAWSISEAMGPGCLIWAALAVFLFLIGCLTRKFWRAGARGIERALSLAEDSEFQARALAREATRKAGGAKKMSEQARTR